MMGFNSKIFIDIPKESTELVLEQFELEIEYFNVVMITSNYESSSFIISSNPKSQNSQIWKEHDNLDFKFINGELVCKAKEDLKISIMEYYTYKKLVNSLDVMDYAETFELPKNQIASIKLKQPLENVLVTSNIGDKYSFQVEEKNYDIHNVIAYTPIDANGKITARPQILFNNFDNRLIFEVIGESLNKYAILGINLILKH